MHPLQRAPREGIEHAKGPPDLDGFESGGPFSIPGGPYKARNPPLTPVRLIQQGEG